MPLTKKSAQKVQKKMRMFVIAFNNNTVFFVIFLLFFRFYLKILLKKHKAIWNSIIKLH